MASLTKNGLTVNCQTIIGSWHFGSSLNLPGIKGYTGDQGGNLEKKDAAGKSCRISFLES
jgi:hypothetical protein